jgi:PPP family 3-phenylpropionic acid transporter
MNRKKIQAQLSITELIYNGCFAAANFLSVFLESIGITAGQMGLITAFVNGISIVSQPVWGIVSDRIRSVKKCFMLCIAGVAVCSLTLPALSQGSGPWRLVMIGMLMVMYFFFHPSNMMMELWLVRVNDHPKLKIPYGSVRSWASIGYALFSLAFVPILQAAPVRSIYYFFAGFAALSILLASRIPAESEGTKQKRDRQRFRDMPFRSMLNYWIIGHIIFEILYQIPFSWRVTYMIYAVKEFGLDSSVYGALMFAAGICEVPMLLLIKRISHRTGWAWLLLISALILTAEYSLYAVGHSVFILFAAQLLRGFSYALYVASRYQYLHRLAPEGLEASTQALVNSVSAVVNFIAAAAGGFLLEACGTRSFFALLCGMQLISCVFFAGLHAVGGKYLHQIPKSRDCMLIRR